MKLIPASRARWMIAMDSSWSGLPQAPNIMAPRQRGLTWTPVRPSGRSCMVKDATEMSDSPSVGLLGLGALGEIFCGHLARAFHGLRVFDLDGAKVARAVERDGALAATSARELAASCAVGVVSRPNAADADAAG